MTIAFTQSSPIETQSQIHGRLKISFNSWLVETKPPTNTPELMKAITRMIASGEQIALRDIFSDRRGLGVAQARQIAIYLAIRRTSWSIARISRYYDRDHTTGLHAQRAVAKRREAVDYNRKILSYLEKIDRIAPMLWPKTELLSANPPP